MKTCNKCNLEKPLEEFHKKRNSGPQPYCKPCSRDYQRELYEKNRLPMLKGIYERRNKRKLNVKKYLSEFYSANPCVDCGETDITTLEFDHTTEKNFGINLAVHDGMSLERLAKELQHGEVRCANCHRKVTAERTQNWRWRYKNGIDLEDTEYTLDD
jgi:transcription elongation factor Elf1